MTATDLTLLYEALDQNPSDHNILIAIADAEMESETGSRLGLGLRALAECKRVPWWACGGRFWCWWRVSSNRVGPIWDEVAKSLLSDDWLELCRGDATAVRDAKIITNGTPTSGAHKAYIAAALAFTLLPTERQDQLLRGEL